MHQKAREIFFTILVGFAGCIFGAKCDYYCYEIAPCDVVKIIVPSKTGGYLYFRSYVDLTERATKQDIIDLRAIFSFYTEQLSSYEFISADKILKDQQKQERCKRIEMIKNVEHGFLHNNKQNLYDKRKSRTFSNLQTRR